LAGTSRILEVGGGRVRLQPEHTQAAPEPWFDLLLAAPRPKVLKRLWPQLAALGAGRPQVIVLGSDSPALPASHIAELLAAESDAALGPTVDGGFYAIACRRIAAEMLDGVRWSSVHTLEDTARAITASVRDGDLGFRYGGDEFALLLPGTDSQSARQIAERVRLAVAAVGPSGSFGVTASVGIADAPRDAHSAEALVRVTDAALYRAKGSGGDRVQTWRETRALSSSRKATV